MGNELNASMTTTNSAWLSESNYLKDLIDLPVQSFVKIELLITMINFCSTIDFNFGDPQPGHPAGI